MKNATPLFWVMIFIFLILSCDNGLSPVKDTNRTPSSSDYTFGNLHQTAGSVIAVTITVNIGKSPGSITNIRYNDSLAIPQVAGIYPVTFDVAAATGWNEASGLSAGNLIVGNSGNQTPVASDYTFGKMNQTAGSVTAVTIEAKTGKSPGAVSNIRYNASITIPQTVGLYPVTFDVAAATGWNAASGLSAGNLIVGNQTPVAGDYTIGNLSQTAGSVTEITITANSGKSPGMVNNIRYNGSTIIPQTVGTYPVTFDVAAIKGWNASTGLSAGNLIVNNRTPIASEYTLNNLNQIVGSVLPVTATPIAGASTGIVTILYNGMPTLPTAAGLYTVTLNVAAITGWNSASGLAGGTLVISNFPGIIIGDKTVKLFLDNGTTPLQESGTTTIISGTGTYSVSITPDIYTKIVWYLNGTIVSEGTKNTSLVFTKRIQGTYLVSIEVIASGEKNTGNHLFVVQ